MRAVLPSRSLHEKEDEGEWPRVHACGEVGGVESSLWHGRLEGVALLRRGPRVCGSGRGALAVELLLLLVLLVARGGGAARPPAAARSNCSSSASFWSSWTPSGPTWPPNRCIEHLSTAAGKILPAGQAMHWHSGSLQTLALQQSMIAPMIAPLVLGYPAELMDA